MSLREESERAVAGGPWLRLKGMRVPIAAGLVFLLLWGVGALGPGLALAGFVLLAAASLLDRDRRPPPPAPARAIERRLPFSEAWLEALLAALPDPVIALNRGEGVVALNSQASALAPALRRNEPISLGLRAPEVLEVIRRARATGSAQRGEFLQRVPIDRWYDVAAVPLPLLDSVPAGELLLLTFHDHTPLRRIEEMRADFIANASHELRTPLASLSGFIDTLLGPARDDAAARERFLGIMHTQADRMARLIDDLLSLSRIELNAHLRPEKEVDLVAVLRQVADGLQTLAHDRAVEIRITAPSSPMLVLGERDELIRVVENLVENALKYAASGKRVDIGLTTHELAGGKHEARIAVQDHGPGIAPEHLPRLTERFYRVDVAESRAQGGTGLGLALVKHILNRHGGRLTIESIPGQGAIFTVHLPLAGRDEPSQLPPAIQKGSLNI
jgi:two-component system phosphate regulon sensor histidine kinase PhoR